MTPEKKLTLRCGENVWHVAKHPHIWPHTQDFWDESTDLHRWVYKERGILASDHKIVDGCFDRYDTEATRFILKSKRGESLATFRFLVASTQQIQVANICPDEYRNLEFLFGKQITEISGFCHPRNVGQDTTVPMLRAVYAFSFEYGTPCWTGIFDKVLPRLLGSRGIMFQVGNRSVDYKGKKRLFCWGIREQMRDALEKIDAIMHNKITV